MKKTYVFILIIMICQIINTSAQEPDIHWLSKSEEFMLCEADDENLIMMNAESAMGIYSHNGICVDNTSHFYSIFIPCKLYAGQTLNAKDGIIASVENVYINYENGKISPATVETGEYYSGLPENIKGVYVCENFGIAVNDEIKFALTTKDKKEITGYIYDTSVTDDIKNFPGKFLFYEGTKLSAVADWNLGKYILDVKEFINFNGKTAFISKTDTGKYVFTPGDTLITAKEEYDEILSARFGYFLVRKDNEYFYISANGKISSAGCERDNLKYREYFIRKTESGTGVCDSSGNIIIPAKYKNIYPVTEGVFVAEKDIADYDIYNQNKLVLKASGWSVNFDFNRIETEYGIYDYSGKKIFEKNILREFHPLKYDIIIEDRENLRIGRAFSENPTVTVNGEYLSSDTPPVIRNNRTLVPLRSIAAAAGFDITYDDKTKKTTVYSDGKSIIFQTDVAEATAGNEKIKLEAAPEIINNRIMIPLRAAADALDFSVTWDEEKRHIGLTDI